MFSWLIGNNSTSPTSLQNGQATTATINHDEFPKIRILVLGDSGTGKTCLIERLVNGKPPTHQPDGR
jgi:GTPase SAR1 family protein